MINTETGNKAKGLGKMVQKRLIETYLEQKPYTSTIGNLVLLFAFVGFLSSPSISTWRAITKRFSLPCCDGGNKIVAFETRPQDHCCLAVDFQHKAKTRLDVVPPQKKDSLNMLNTSPAVIYLVPAAFPSCLSFGLWRPSLNMSEQQYL